MNDSSFEDIDNLRRRSNLVFALVFLGIGAAALTLAVIQLASTIVLFSRTRSAVGTYVEDVDRQEVFNGGTFQHARFQFRSDDGKVRFVTASDGSTQLGHVIGDTATIRYEPADPNRAVVCSFWTLWIGPLFCGVFAVAFGLPGLLMLVRQLRGETQNDLSRMS